MKIKRSDIIFQYILVVRPKKPLKKLLENFVDGCYIATKFCLLENSTNNILLVIVHNHNDHIKS